MALEHHTPEHVMKYQALSWLFSAAIASGANEDVSLGGATIVPHVEVYTSGMPRFVFGCWAAGTLNLNILHSIDGANWSTLLTLAVLAATYTTVYDLAAPMNATGFLVLQWPMTKINLANTSGASNNVRFWASAYGR